MIRRRFYSLAIIWALCLISTTYAGEIKALVAREAFFPEENGRYGCVLSADGEIEYYKRRKANSKLKPLRLQRARERLRKRRALYREQGRPRRAIERLTLRIRFLKNFKNNCSSHFEEDDLPDRSPLPDSTPSPTARPTSVPTATATSTPTATPTSGALPDDGAVTPLELGDLELPRDRVPNWIHAGVDGGIPETSNPTQWPVINATDYGANPACDGGYDRNEIQNALDYAASLYGDGRSGTVVKLPDGCYGVGTSGIEIPSNVLLQGTSSDNTVVKFVSSSPSPSPREIVEISGSSRECQITWHWDSLEYVLDDGGDFSKVLFSLTGYPNVDPHGQVDDDASGIIGLSDYPAQSPDDLAALIRFSIIDGFSAWDGNTGRFRSGPSIPFVNRREAAVRFEINRQNSTYSVFIDDEPLAEDFAFRTGVSPTQNLNRLTGFVDSRYISTCEPTNNLVIAGYERGSTELTFLYPPGLVPGEYFRIREDHDPLKFDTFRQPPPFITQILRVVSVSGNKVQIDRALAETFARHPRIMHMSPVENAGLEHVKLMFPTKIQWGYNDLMRISGAVNSWVRNVFFYWGDNGHLSIAASRDITVESSRFERLDYTEPPGSGGEGNIWNSRAIGIIEGATDTLVWNNIFRFVEATCKYESMPIRNVFAYNYSRDLMVNQRDMWLHGEYPTEILFEGNDTDGRAEADNRWGRQGPRNYWFRNRALDEIDDWAGLTTHLDSGVTLVGDQHGFIGNLGSSVYGYPGCTPPDCVRQIDQNHTNFWAEKNRFIFQATRYSDEPTSTFVAEPMLCSGSGGLCDGFAGPCYRTCNGYCYEDTDYDGRSAPAAWSNFHLPKSLFLRAKPHFWCNELPWPAIGADVDDVSALEVLPAERRALGLSCSINN